MGDSQVRSPITPSIQEIVTLLNYWCMKWCHGSIWQKLGVINEISNLDTQVANPG
jgi:hypothetical protein